MYRAFTGEAMGWMKRGMDELKVKELMLRVYVESLRSSPESKFVTLAPKLQRPNKGNRKRISFSLVKPYLYKKEDCSRRLYFHRHSLRNSLSVFDNFPPSRGAGPHPRPYPLKGDLI
jgi:hypothetical protein